MIADHQQKIKSDANQKDLTSYSSTATRRAAVNQSADQKATSSTQPERVVRPPQKKTVQSAAQTGLPKTSPNQGIRQTEGAAAAQGKPTIASSSPARDPLKLPLTFEVMIGRTKVVDPLNMGHLTALDGLVEIYSQLNITGVEDELKKRILEAHKTPRKVFELPSIDDPDFKFSFTANKVFKIEANKDFASLKPISRQTLSAFKGDLEFSIKYYMVEFTPIILPAVTNPPPSHGPGVVSA